MNRFFLDPDLISDDQVRFPKDIAHQILHVLRLGDGDSVEVLDDSGWVFRVDLAVDPQRNRVIGRIRDKKPASSESKVRLILYFGLSNRDKVEWILQKATEIGVSELSPFVSSRTLVQSTSLSEKRVLRWKRIIREAAEQSQRGELPVLNRPMEVEACFRQAAKETDLCLIAWEGADSHNRDIDGWAQDFKGDSIALFVGPEGGFSETEIQVGEAAGCEIVSLGRRILRMETAAIVFPAIVLHKLGEL